MGSDKGLIEPVERRKMRSSNSMQGWIKVFDRFSVKGGVDQGKRIFVTVDQKPIYGFLETNHSGDYHLTALVRELLNLSADSFPPHSRPIDSSQPNKRQLALDGGCIKYYLYNGDVYVEKLEHGNSFQSLRTNSGSGLYRAMWDHSVESWEATKASSLDTNVQIGGAHCAAISGRQFSRSEEAARSLSVHIQKAFTIRKGEMEALDKHYSLYFVNKGEHKSDIRSREVA